jgi:hypothetical protein
MRICVHRVMLVMLGIMFCMPACSGKGSKSSLSQSPSSRELEIVPAQGRPENYPVDFPYIEGGFIYPTRTESLSKELQRYRRVVLVYSLSQKDLAALVEKHLEESGWAFRKELDEHESFSTVRFIATKGNRQVFASVIATPNSTSLQVAEWMGETKADE